MIATALAAVILFPWGMVAQVQAPAFEVATVRPSGPDSPPMALRREPSGRLVTTNTPLAWLVNWAFNLDEGRLFAVPNGAESARFDIVAVPGPNPGPGQLQLMMQTLLTDRFGLAVHRETRELTSYELAVETGGPKLKPSAADQPTGPNPFNMTTPGTLIGSGVTLDMIARLLSDQLRRPVANKADVSGRFDFTLDWAPDSAAGVDDRPSLFTALREQLGLRLVARSTAVEVVVVDRLNLIPTEN